MPTQPLISAVDLAERLGSATPPALLDVRWALGGPSGLDAFSAGHIPGAVYVDLDTELAGPIGPGTGRHPLPSLGDLEASARAWGVRRGQSVVVYDDGGGMSAARAWWLLRWGGVSEVQVLDGGLAAWRAEGRLIVTESNPVQPGDVELSADNAPVLTAEQAAALAQRGVLLDARAGERYRGEVEPVDPVAGHIPGAVSAPTAENLAEGGKFKDAEALRARFAGLGVDGSSEVGVYCGSGVTAAHQALALASIGIEAALYPGSWSEWITDPARPVAIG
ncbi:MAG: sulfurtransferase [Frankiales bacterium]|nr:sulfurtransferase [Frankiales bacterium]